MRGMIHKATTACVLFAALALPCAVAAGDGDAPVVTAHVELPVSEVLGRIARATGGDAVVEPTLGARVVRVPGAALDDAASLRYALHEQDVAVIEVPTEAGVVVHGLQLQASMQHVPALLPVRVADGDAYPAAGVFVERVIRLDVPARRAAELFGHAQRALVRDEPRVGQLHLVYGEAVYVARGLSSQVEAVEALVRSLEEGEDPEEVVRAHARAAVRPPMSLRFALGLEGPLGHELMELRAAHRGASPQARAEAERALLEAARAAPQAVSVAARAALHPAMRASLGYVGLRLEHGDGAVAFLLDELRRPVDARRRQEITMLLGRCTEAADAAPLAEAVLTHPDQSVRAAAVGALGAGSGETGLDALRRVVLEAGERQLRWRALRALQERGDPDLPAFLIELAGSAPDDNLRRTAVSMLGSAGGPAHRELYLGLIWDAAQEDLRIQAAYWFRRHGDARDIAELEAVLRFEENERVRQVVQSSIVQIRRTAKER
jgi:hypothetical protein